jgi:hypothetical protein
VKKRQKSRRRRRRKRRSCCCCFFFFSFFHGYPSRSSDTAPHYSLLGIAPPTVASCIPRIAAFLDAVATARWLHAHDGHMTNTDAPSRLYSTLSLALLHRNHKRLLLLLLPFSIKHYLHCKIQTTHSFIHGSYVLFSLSLSQSVKAFPNRQDLHLNLDASQRSLSLSLSLSLSHTHTHTHTTQKRELQNHTLVPLSLFSFFFTKR